MGAFALPIAIGLSAVTSIAGGIIQSNAAKKAAAENARVQREAIAAQERARAQVRQDSLAQIEIGQRAARTLAGTGSDSGQAIGGAEGLGLDRTFEDERADFLEAEATRSINQAAAARGQAFSGAALEAIGRQSTDIRTASTQREVDLLQGLAGLGTNAAAGVGQASANLSGQTSQSLASIGAGNAQGIADQGTALAGGIRGVGDAALLGGVLGGGSSGTVPGSSIPQANVGSSSLQAQRLGLVP